MLMKTQFCWLSVLEGQEWGLISELSWMRALLGIKTSAALCQCPHPDGKACHVAGIRKVHELQEGAMAQTLVPAMAVLEFHPGSWQPCTPLAKPALRHVKT